MADLPLYHRQYKTAEEMADQLGFNEDQREQMAELLADENNWYGFDSRVEWCACFVSWCANECGYIEVGVIPKFAACASQGVPWFRERGFWQDNSYEPRPGDIIFFDWDDGGQDGSSDHVGIVVKVENGRIYTIEGNSDDSYRQHNYPVGDYEIYGYGTPAYQLTKKKNPVITGWVHKKEMCLTIRYSYYKYIILCFLYGNDILEPYKI